MIVWNEFVNDARVLKEAETLQKNGYQVIVHALHTPGKTLENETLTSGVRVVRVARSPFWKIRKKNITTNLSKSINAKSNTSASLSRQILKIIARIWTHFSLFYQLAQSKPLAIHAHDVNVLPTAWLASKVARSYLVYDAHEISTDREGYSNFRNLVGFVEKKVTPNVDGMITTTDVRAKFFARAYGIDRPTVLQNRPNYHRLPTSNEIRDKLDLKNTHPIVLYQGGLQQGRGLHLLVESANSIKNAYFVFIGGGRLEYQLKSQVERLGLSDRVFFIPTVSLADLPVYTASADIGVQAIENTCLNHFSTDSNKLFEYIMAGLPIVSTDFPEIKKVVKNFDLGFLTKSGDLAGLIVAIQKLVNDKALRKKYSNNALASAKDLCWERQEKLLVDMYKNIVK